MPNTRKILIVDDDPEMRDALTEQLSLLEEFEALAVENGSKGVQASISLSKQSAPLTYERSLPNFSMRSECTSRPRERTRIPTTSLGKSSLKPVTSLHTSRIV